ncbi:MAG TPA: hypothetical protein VK891_10685 [Euzebyales bacterium]|nr:hypothetical protein [Euzebyales bacterium]
MTYRVSTALSRHDPGLRRVGRLMRTVGLVGVVAGVAAIAVCLWLLHDVDRVFGRSLVVSAESLATVDDSLAVAAESVAAVGAGLDDAEQTSRGLEASLSEGADLLQETARLTRNDVASSLESFQRSLPALIEVSGTVDRTLRAVDELPVGPEYNPEEPFDESLQSLHDDLEGLPGDLREQAAAIDQAGDNLAVVGRQSVDIADSLQDVRVNLDRAGRVLGDYQATASEARGLLEETQADLGRRLWILRALVVVLGLVYCIGQVLPIYLGHRMATMFAPPAKRAGAADHEPRDTTPPSDGDSPPGSAGAPARASAGAAPAAELELRDHTHDPT